MAYKQYYGNAIWTNHALERLGQRMLPQDMAWQAFNKPDATVDGKVKGSKEFQKQIGNYFVTIIAKLNDQREWVIVSCWVDPPFTGSIDIEKKKRWKQYRKSPLWMKFLLDVKRQLGF